jgi:hypothetical protein
MSGRKLQGGEACAKWYDEICYDFTTGNAKAGSLGAVIGECFNKLPRMTCLSNSSRTLRPIVRYVYNITLWYTEKIYHKNYFEKYWSPTPITQATSLN